MSFALMPGRAFASTISILPTGTFDSVSASCPECNSCTYFGDNGSGSCVECTGADVANCAEAGGGGCPFNGLNHNRYTVIYADVAAGSTAGLPVTVNTGDVFSIPVYVDQKYAGLHNVLVSPGSPVPQVYDGALGWVDGELNMVSYGPAAASKTPIPGMVPPSVAAANANIVQVSFDGCSGYFDALGTIINTSTFCSGSSCVGGGDMMIGEDILVPRGVTLPAGGYLPVAITDMWGTTYGAGTVLPFDVVVGVETKVPQETIIPAGVDVSMAFMQNVIEKPDVSGDEVPDCTAAQISSGDTADCKLPLEEGTPGEASTPGSSALPNFKPAVPTTDEKAPDLPGDLFPYFRGANSASDMPPTCNPQAMDMLEARAWAEAQREMTQNETLISKPDSVLQYNCFDSALDVLAKAAEGKYLFSELAKHPYMGTFQFLEKIHMQIELMNGQVAGLLDPAGTEGLDMNSVLGMIVLDSLVKNVSLSSVGNFCRRYYIDNNFDYNYLGGRSSSNYSMSTKVHDHTYSCGVMQKVWQVSMCNNAMRFSADEFRTLQDYADKEKSNNDYREFPKKCKANGGLGTQDALCNSDQVAQKSTILAVAGINLGKLTWEGAMEAAFPSAGMQGAHDAYRSFIERLDPDNCSTLQPVKLGFKVKLTSDIHSFEHTGWLADGPQEYEDAVCVAPGCWYDPSSDTCEPHL